MFVNTPYSVSFFDWNLEERMSLLNEGRVSCELNVENKTITPLLLLSSGQEEIFNFVKDPIYPIKFWKLDNSLGKAALELHYKFWSQRFEQ